MNVLSLFDGISCGQVALQQSGIKVDKYFASEIDKRAIKIAQKNFPQIVQLGCVKTVKASDVGEIDLLLAGSPCQGFSRSGKKARWKDQRSGLFFEFLRLLQQTKPTFFLLENVLMKKENEQIIDDLLGIEGVKINAKLVSCQNRNRVYWTNIPFTMPKDQGIKLESIVGPYDGIWVQPRGKNKGGVRDYKGLCPTLTKSAWQWNFKLVQNGKIRQFTAEEAEQVQGLPIGYTSGASNHARFQTIGNGWSIPVVKHIFKGLR